MSSLSFVRFTQLKKNHRAWSSSQGELVASQQLTLRAGVCYIRCLSIGKQTANSNSVCTNTNGKKIIATCKVMNIINLVIIVEELAILYTVSFRFWFRFVSCFTDTHTKALAFWIGNCQVEILSTTSHHIIVFISHTALFGKSIYRVSIFWNLAVSTQWIMKFNVCFQLNQHNLSIVGTVFEHNR